MESRLLIGERVAQSILMVIGGKLTPSSEIVSFLKAQQIFNDFLCQLFESTTLASPSSDSSPRIQRCRLHRENFDFPIFSLNQPSTMDTTHELASDCEVEEVVLNNLVSSQLVINDDPEEDWKIFEKIVFDDQAKSYNRLDAKSSMRIFSEFQKVDRGKKPLQSLLETSTEKFFSSPTHQVLALPHGFHTGRFRCSCLLIRSEPAANPVRKREEAVDRVPGTPALNGETFAEQQREHPANLQSEENWFEARVLQVLSHLRPLDWTGSPL